MKPFWCLLGIVLGGGGFAPLAEAGDGDEVVVVYNSRMPGSKAVAEYYADRRQVPKRQVFGFDLPTGEDISRAEFRESLQLPLAKKFKSGKLWRLGAFEVPATNGRPARIERKVFESKIRYLVLCYGVPLRVLHDPNLREPAEETMRPELRRNGASVDTELAWLPVLEQSPTLAGPLRNPSYTTTNAAAVHPTNGVLIVTRLDGPTPDIARGLVDKALQAEQDGLWGRAYFDLRATTDPNLKMGEDWIRGAADMTRHFGFETVVDEKPDTFPPGFPMSQIALYMGWYRETVAGPFALPTVEFMPGAFAYHLHSFSGATLRGTNQNWVAPFLARGVTCTMGCVDEPYLIGTPDVAVFLGRLLYHRFNFGQAAYAGQSILSWQTTVVGDPLYHPFGKNPQALHQELQRRGSRFIEWSYLRSVNLNQARNVPVTEVVRQLEILDFTKQSAVLTEKLADLYALQGKPSSAALTLRQALKLDPTPQQRIRLRLSLGEKLEALNRDEEAYDNWQQFLAEAPDYPDLPAIYRKLLPLAQKLGKTEDTAKYSEQLTLLTAPPAPKP